MSKELPWFKFYVSEWIMGDITMCSMEAQGLFVNIMAYYWKKDCSICLAFAKQRYSNHISALEELLNNQILKVDENENIHINFLDEQYDDRSKTSQKRALAGAKGGKASAKQLLSKPKAKSSNIEVEVEEEKEVDIDLKEKQEKEIFACDHKEDLTEDDRKLIDDLVSFFHVNQVHDYTKMRLILSAINIHKFNARLDYFKKQFTAYKKYKTETKEKIHSLNSFLGNEREGCAGAGWDARNWEEELKQIPSKKTKGADPDKLDEYEKDFFKKHNIEV